MLTAIALLASSLSFTLDYTAVNYTEPDAHGECTPQLVVRGTGDFSAFEDDGQPLDGSICLVTNDPSEPLQTITLSATNTGSAIGIGEMALDFTLSDLDGTPHTLSAQLGHPVVLAYFATW